MLDDAFTVLPVERRQRRAPHKAAGGNLRVFVRARTATGPRMRLQLAPSRSPGNSADACRPTLSPPPPSRPAESDPLRSVGRYVVGVASGWVAPDEDTFVDEPVQRAAPS